jgi:hypothetical protein
MGIGKTVGELVTESNGYGKMLTASFSDAVNTAITRARDEAESGAPRRAEAAEETEK